jgi:hypothetical protein
MKWMDCRTVDVNSPPPSKKAKKVDKVKIKI